MTKPLKGRPRTQYPGHHIEEFMWLYTGKSVIKMVLKHPN